MVNQFKDNDPPFNDSTLLEVYGLKDVRIANNMAYLLLFFLSFFGLTWFMLSYKKYSAR